MWPWNAGVLDPHGPVAEAERLILINATAIMLTVIVPVILMTLLCAWRFRSGNLNALRLPDWSYSGRIELVVWSIPVLIIMFLGGIAWTGSHHLDPYKPLHSHVPPIRIDVVSLDWKWLFIYPGQNIASVNQLTVPADVPISFRLTSASVMNSFFVPQLGSQIYTMARMTTQLNLQASQPGTYAGLSAMFSGDGFSDMRFNIIALPSDAFKHWLETTQKRNDNLDAAGYAKLARQGIISSPRTYSSVEPHLFESIVNGDAPAPGKPHKGQPSADISPRTGD